MTEVDYAQTSVARQNRQEKALAVATWCWNEGIPAQALIVAAISVPEHLRWLAKAAGVHPPKVPGDREARPAATWHLAADLLHAKELHAAEHPGDPRNARRGSGARPGCCTCPPLCERGDDEMCLDARCAVCVNGCPALEETACCRWTGDQAPVVVAEPKGWRALVAAGPLAGADARPCGFCPEPAIVVATTTAGPPAARCAGHPPAPGEWGARLDWKPRACVKPLRCYCGRPCAPGATTTVAVHTPNEWAPDEEAWDDVAAEPTDA